MANVGVLLSGAVLFLNSLMLRKKAETKSVAIFNFFVGILQIIIPLYLIMVSDQNTWTIYGYTATFLFGLTFLYVSFTFYKGMDGSGLGWFSAWVTMIAIFYAFVSAFHFQNYVQALTWVMWAFLWYLFYVLNVLKKPIADYVGKVAFVQSFVTLTFPALLTLIGIWEEVMIQRIWIVVLVVSVLYFVKAGFELRTNQQALE
ncbi:AmiS/UreI family transporter [Bacillus massiliigorillae]|uniref:AmiS/UreI family transporter n=1 Tax=Bacillus massiliigorillae TaxID=1243664 RepID=UPI0003A1C393|nr:AmiS/UreI family transporter [Bacillus massiliigorillae]